MASLAMWVIRVAKKFPLPRAARDHLDRCVTIELFDSVFDPRIGRPSLAHVLGFLPLADLCIGFEDSASERTSDAMLSGDIESDSLALIVFDDVDLIQRGSDTLH